jgi:hypothetical protein
VISFHSDSDSAFAPYAFQLVSDFCGLKLYGEGDERRQTSTVDALDIYHGNENGVSCRLRIPLVQGGYSAETVPALPDKSAFDLAHSGEPFPFDLVAAFRFWLADEGNAKAARSAYDSHDRLRAAASVQHFRGVTEVPIVNAYLILARHWLERRLDVRAGPSLPPGKRAVVVLSHDVDRPLDPTDLKPILLLAAKGLVRGRAVRSIVRSARATAKAAWTKVREPAARTWLFHEIVGAEERYGFSSTFFFATTPCLFRPGHAVDVFYDITSPKLRTICRELSARGSEVGLHVGYNAKDLPGQIRREKGRLEEVAGADVVGCRHHYWHTGRTFWRTLEAHADAGLRYDSSLAFNDAPGFRLGIARATRPWNPLLQRATDVVQVPPMLMDGALLSDRTWSVDDILAYVERLLATLKQFEGVASIDWHQEGCLPASRYYRVSGEAYLAVLDLIASDPELLVQTCRQVTESQEAREMELRSAS